MFYNNQLPHSPKEDPNPGNKHRSHIYSAQATGFESPSHGSDSKESACNVGDPGSIPGSGRSPGEGDGNPTPVFLPGKFHEQGSLVGYSP